MMRNPLAILLVTISLLAGLPAPALARDPQKLDNSSLDRRVLSRPGALLRRAPGEGSEALRKPPVFSTYYVFDNRTEGGADWLEVGGARDGAATAWIRTDQTLPWKHTIVLAFANAEGRIPVLFFEDREALQRLLQDEMVSNRAELLAQAIRGGESVPGSGVIAAEPAEMVPLTQQFYLLPVLEADQVKVNNRLRRIVRIASINQEAAASAAAAAAPAPFRVGVVFVIDTSISMDPYIARTKEAIARILKGLSGEDERQRISFGMVGFRGNAEAVPALEYTSKVFYPLKPEFDERAFFKALDGMRAATVSSRDFDEDGLSGLIAATEMPGWADFDGRYVIYVSDAGMLVGRDQGSLAGTTPELLAGRLRHDRGIAVFSMFLKTRAGRAYHEDALRQLAEISRVENVEQPLVYEIADGSVAEFGSRVDALTAALLSQVRDMAAARAPAPDACAADPQSVACAASEVGQAMRLAWLGRQNQARAPDVYEAWAADRSLDDFSRWAMNARVLLTRNQLNDLYVTLQALVEAFQSPETRPETFFSVLKTTLAHAMRDPSRLPALDPSQRGNRAQIEEFDDLGDLLGEYFRGLPYDSDLADITQEVWNGMGPPGHAEVMENVKAKLAMYELYYADSANWIAITDGGGEGEKVYPVPLEMMP